jgi:BirA family biotin operon repressor/biotin-[acetyl-CoA-carboxylase] ligase
MAAKTGIDSSVALRVSTTAGWRLHEYQEVTSTNLLAANLPAWTAVRADTQTRGRGRFQRSWVSDQGGLWLSAVVPAEEAPLARRALPLAAGLAVSKVLQELGIHQARLRWPNDVLVADRKLAGLLIDQFVPGLAVVGIGLNVSNQPEACEPALKNQTTRLADLLPHSPPPELTALALLVLEHLAQVLVSLGREGPSALFRQVNLLWGEPRPVELDLDGTLRRGLFTGLDSEGRLTLSDSVGKVDFYDAHEVRHLTET